MNRSQWIALVAGLSLVMACFMPWVIIRDPYMIISGMDPAESRFGKPGFAHFVLTGLLLFFSFVPRLWAKRLNLVIGALNLAWAIRNFMVMSRCEGGECPEKQWGLYLALVASVALMISTFLPELNIGQADEDADTDAETNQMPAE
jgi:hypothetical protein